MISRGLNYLQAYPMLRIYRGYDPLNPRFLSAEHRVKSTLVDTIKAGMIIFPKWNSSDGCVEWVLDPTADTAITSPNPHIAFTDANRYDVVQSDRLVGLPCSGDFVLHTPHYEHDVADSEYVLGAPLTWGINGTLVTVNSTADPVVAQIVDYNAPFDISGEDNTFKKDGTLASAEYVDARVKQVIKIKTCFVPLAVADVTP